MKKQLGPSDALFPVPAALIVSGSKDETHIDEDKADETKRGGLDISKIDPLVYCAEVREYWTLGNLLGFGFNAGKEIKTKLKDAATEPIPHKQHY